MTFAYQPLLAASAALQAGDAYKLAADAGPMSVTGFSAETTTARRLEAENGVAVLSDHYVAVKRSLFLLLDSGEIVVSGESVNLLEGLSVGTQTGSLSVSGYSANPAVVRNIAVDPAAFDLSGLDAAVDAPARIITLAPRSLDLNGQQTILSASRYCGASEAQFGISGTGINILADAGTVSPSAALNFSLSISL